MNHFKLFLGAALVALPTSALADPITVMRCSADQLSIDNAHLRIEWARKCALSLNTGAVANSGNPANFFPSARVFDLASLMTTPTGAKEYREPAGVTRRYTAGMLYNGEINYT